MEALNVFYYCTYEGTDANTKPKDSHSYNSSDAKETLHLWRYSYILVIYQMLLSIASYRNGC